MKYNQPYGVSDPQAPYINGNPSTGTMGSIPPAASIEYPQREIVNLINDVGLTPSNSDLNQLAKAIQSGQLFYGLDTGSANHMVTSLVPLPDALRRGMFVLIHAAANNTGATDLTTNGVSAAVTRPNGAALIPGDISANGMVLLIFDGTRWQMPTGGGGSSLKYLTQPLDLYVNAAIGNDANDGISNTAGHAFLTVQHAVDVCQSYLPSNFGIFVHVADGTYNEAVSTTFVASPAINIIGNVANPDNVIIGLSGTCTFPKLAALMVNGPNYMNIQGVCGRSGSYAIDSPSAFIALSGATMVTKNTSSLFCQAATWEAYGGASVNIDGNHKFKSSAPPSAAAILAYSGGNIFIRNSLNVNFTFEPGVSFSVCTVEAINAGTVEIQGHHLTFSGPTPTGMRYQAYNNGMIDTQGGGANYIPGTALGQVFAGGQYS